MRDARWDNLTDVEWTAFAKAWNAELCGDVPPVPLPAIPWLLGDPPKTAIGYVVPMNFTASPVAQWKFIVAAFLSGNESTYGHLGPDLLSICWAITATSTSNRLRGWPLAIHGLRKCWKVATSTECQTRFGGDCASHAETSDNHALERTGRGNKTGTEGHKPLLVKFLFLLPAMRSGGRTVWRAYGTERRWL